jgi:hypothetical protein
MGEEFAPRSPDLREGLSHIAEAAQRDRARTAAHDEALRAENAHIQGGRTSGSQKASAGWQPTEPPAGDRPVSTARPR